MALARPHPTARKSSLRGRATIDPSYGYYGQIAQNSFVNSVVVGSFRIFYDLRC
jgi:hypothetical protein